jgi:hypothetical protein
MREGSCAMLRVLQKSAAEDEMNNKKLAKRV